MKNNEFLNFIAPQFEFLQLSFFVIILVMFFGTIISTWLYAKNTSWEKNWNNATPDDKNNGLDIDHGSVTDLWHAVATKSEKLAEVMPGMLLVVGLLGTFLGLGLALNHASNILGQSDALSTTGAASNMQDLMSMMQGLGTKFKTSTWGITFFLLLKVWSSWFGFEEKRLTWVIRKVKSELERRKAQEQEEKSNKQHALFAKISQAAEQITQGFTKNLENLSDSQKTFHQYALQYLGKGMQAINGHLTTINTTLQNDSTSIKLMLEQSTQGIREDLSNINTTLQNDSTSIKLMLEQSTQGIREDLSNINTTLQNDSTSIKLMLEQSTQGIREDLSNINAATQTSSQAMVGFVSSTQTIIKDMSEASNKMADGANKVGIAGSSLVDAVNDFSTQFTHVLSDVRTDLSNAINNMSKQAAQTLEQGSRELKIATDGISKALGILSNDVTITMNGVKDSMEKSLKIQERGAIQFQNSSESLSEQGEVIKNLGEKIFSGLQAVSDAGRRMVGIAKSLDVIVPQMSDLLPALEPLKTLHIYNQQLLDEVKVLHIALLKFDSHQELQYIKTMIENALEIRQNELNIFHAASDMLNTNFAATTGLVNKLSDDIRNGLDTISTSSRSMFLIEKSLESIVFQVGNLPPALEPLKALNVEYKKLITEVQGMRQDFQVQIQSLVSLKNISSNKLVNVGDPL